MIRDQIAQRIAAIEDVAGVLDNDTLHAALDGGEAGATSLGEAEPGPEVTHVLTAAGRTWRRNANTGVGGWFNEDGHGVAWARLYREDRPLVDITPKEG